MNSVSNIATSVYILMVILAASYLWMRKTGLRRCCIGTVFWSVLSCFYQVIIRTSLFKVCFYNGGLFVRA